MNENDISYDIRGAIFKVFNAFGPGLFESVYCKALEAELTKMGHFVETEVAVPVYYDNKKLEIGFIIDILVDKKVMIEVKSVKELENVHHKQVLTYLKLTNLKLGILVNFNESKIIEGIYRKVNGL